MTNYDNWTVSGASAGDQARDEAMEQVARGSPEYMAGGLLLIAQLPTGMLITGEEIRLRCLNSGLRYHHPNVNGSLISCAIRNGLLLPTGSRKKMEVPHNHSRTNPIYRVRMRLQPVDIMARLLEHEGEIFEEAAAEIKRLRKLVGKMK